MAHKIVSLDLVAQYKTIKKEIDIAIQRVLDSGNFIGGEEVEGLEREMAKFCGVRYALGLNSGTDALFLSLKALNIGPGDEVITTPFTFFATVEVIANLGAKPVFVDIDPKTFNINPSEIEKAITKKTKAIIPVHLFGQMAEMGEIMRIAKKYKLFVVEDAAQAIGATIKIQEFKNLKTRKAGTIGDLGCFSFFPSKNLGAYGDAGMIVTNDKKLADKIKLLRNHGSSPSNKYLNLLLATNSRLDTLQAAILRVKLKYLIVWNKEREKAANFYNENLKEVSEVAVPFIAPDRNHIFHQYTIRAKNRDGLHDYLGKKGIQTAIYYPLPLHFQPAFKYLKHKAGSFPEAEKASKEVLSLPVYPELEPAEQDYINQKIKEFFVRGI